MSPFFVEGVVWCHSCDESQRLSYIFVGDFGLAEAVVDRPFGFEIRHSHASQCLARRGVFDITKTIVHRRIPSLTSAMSLEHQACVGEHSTCSPRWTRFRLWDGDVGGGKLQSRPTETDPCGSSAWKALPSYLMPPVHVTCSLAGYLAAWLPRWLSLPRLLGRSRGRHQSDIVVTLTLA